MNFAPNLAKVEAEPAETPAKRGRKPATKPAEEVVVVDLEKAA